MTGRRVALTIGCAAASLALAGCSVGVGEATNRVYFDVQVSKTPKTG